MADTINITTGSGFACSIEEDAFDDYELLTALIDFESKNAMKAISGIETILISLLGEEQKKTLFEHIREKHGRVKLSAIKDEILQIFAKVGESKKK